MNEGSGTNGGSGIFVTLHKEAFENCHFFRLDNPLENARLEIHDELPEKSRDLRYTK